MAFDANSTLDIDSVFSMEVDIEDQKAIGESLLLPEGDYITITPLTVNEPRSRKAKNYGERVNGSYQQLDEPVEVERTVIQFSAQVVSQGKDGEEDGLYKGRVRLEFSPETVYTVDRKGRFGPDRLSKINRTIITLFTKDNERAPSTYAELIEYVKTTPIKLFIGKLPESDDGQFPASNMVFSVSRAG